MYTKITANPKGSKENLYFLCKTEMVGLAKSLLEESDWEIVSESSEAKISERGKEWLEHQKLYPEVMDALN